MTLARYFYTARAQDYYMAPAQILQGAIHLFVTFGLYFTALILAGKGLPFFFAGRGVQQGLILRQVYERSIDHSLQQPLRHTTK